MAAANGSAYGASWGWCEGAMHQQQRHMRRHNVTLLRLSARASRYACACRAMRLFQHAPLHNISCCGYDCPTAATLPTLGGAILRHGARRTLPKRCRIEAKMVGMAND